MISLFESNMFAVIDNRKNDEIKSIAEEMVLEYGKKNSIKECFELIKASETVEDMQLYADVADYISKNYDDDMTFGYWS